MEIARKAGTSIDRLRITKGSDGSLIPNKNSLTVYDTGLREQSTIYVKDIGKTPCYPYLPALLSVSYCKPLQI